MPISSVSELGEQIATEILRQPSRKIQPDEPLISSELLDSLSLVDMAFFVEDRYGVVIDCTELTSETFDTLTQLAELIESRSKKSS